MKTRLGQLVRNGLFLAVVVCAVAFAPVTGFAAPYAAMVIDARSGEVLHSRNADTRLHPASLTKMMTLYVTFQAIEHGEISLDTVITISKKAASEPPSKLGLKPGQKIKLRYLIRAAAVKSANDAATAIGEAVAGSEAAFARRMTRTAKALGMTRSTFKNAHGLTESGHLSTARDMTMLGRHLFYDYPDYYNLFSRRTTDAGMREVANTNRRLLGSYAGADGIKTGYTRAAGFNLVASARRGNERIIATVFGGRSSATRNARVAELLDMGFRRAPSRVAVRKPAKPGYSAPQRDVIVTDSRPGATPAAGKTIRVSGAVKKSLHPRPRPATETPPADLLIAMQGEIESALEEVQVAGTQAPPQEEEVQVAAAEAPQAEAPQAEATEELNIAALIAAEVAAAAVSSQAPQPVPASAVATSAQAPASTPRPRPAEVVLASIEPETLPAAQAPVIVTRISTSGGRHWGVNVGQYPSRYAAERMLLKTALKEMSTLDGSLRKVVKGKRGFDANFMGLSRETADLACRRLVARNIDCTTIGPG